MRTDAELDALHESLVAKYPGGLTIAQFKQCVLESADDEGRVYPPSVQGFSVIPHSILMSMVLRDKTIEPGWTRPDQPEWFRITEAGRRALAQAKATS